MMISSVPILILLTPVAIIIFIILCLLYVLFGLLLESAFWLWGCALRLFGVRSSGEISSDSPEDDIPIGDNSLVLSNNADFP
jgi:hypothetical protein